MKKANRMIKIAASLALILTMVLCLGACGTKTAKVADASGDGWNYKQDTKTLTVTGSGAMKSFESASAVDWASVREGVEKIVVGAGLTTVGDYAFYGMSHATEIVLPEGITSIGTYAFGFCASVEGISIPASVTSIGDSAFEACTALKSIVVSPNVTSIGARAFALCSSMTDATVVANVSELRAETFYYCRSLNNLVLHTGISAERVDPTAFAEAARGFADAERRDTVEGSYEIVITYVYEDGTEAAPAVAEEKLSGENYLYITPAKEGYTPDKEQVQGVMQTAGVRETVTYKKNAETEPVETTPVETTPVKTEEEKSRGELILSVVILAVVVVGIVVGGILLVRSDKKSKQKNAPKNGKKK